jgi:hypothetical protein
MGLKRKSFVWKILSLKNIRNTKKVSLRMKDSMAKYNHIELYKLNLNI